MTGPGPTAILYPAFAMFALVAIVLARLARLRLGAVRRGEMQPGFYRTYDEGSEPPEIRVVTRHFINLFEVPTLFYVVLIMTYVTNQASGWMILCGWLYVAMRCAHSYVHLTSNEVLLRFRLYFASGVLLLIMWATLLLGLLLA